MKQKYKVFINDQEIVFQSINPKHTPSEHIIAESAGPLEIYSSIINNNQRAGYTSIVHTSNPKQSFDRFRNYFTTIEAAGGLVRSKDTDGDILMIFRLGKWDLPKGKIEKNEQPDWAAIREVEEECGISGLKIIKSLENTYHMYEYKDQPVIKNTHWYLMVSSDERVPIPQEEEGISKVEWVAPDKIEQITSDCYRSVAELLETEVLNR